MNLTKWDFQIIIAMTLAVILMSFTFSAFGFTADPEAEESDIPEFDIETDRFDFRGEFPESPGMVGEGFLVYDQSNPADIHHMSNEWIEGDAEDGVRIAVRNDSHPQAEVWFQTFEGGGIQEEDKYQLGPEIGDWVQHDNMSYVITFILNEPYDPDVPHYRVFWRIEERPDDDGENGGLVGWIVSNVPLFSTLIETGSEVAAVVLWIGQIILWGITWFFEIALNLLGILVDVMIFLGSMVLWLITTYSEIVSTAESWASLFVAIPGILLMVELGKVVLVFVARLPST